METNNEGINRRNIPVEFMDYIAQAFGYEIFADVPEKRLSAVTEMIKIRLLQTEASIRRPYAKKYETITRRPRETALQFAVRVDNRDPYPKVTETPGTEPGDTVLRGCPFDEPLPLIPGDAWLVRPAFPAGGTLSKEFIEGGATEKHAYFQKTGDSEKLTEDNGDRRFWPIRPETVTNASGKVFRLSEEEMNRAEKRLSRVVHDELLIETNQQWGVQELAEFTKKQFEESFLIHNRRFDSARPGADKTVYAVISGGETHIRNFTPDNWPAVAPPYFSAAGWAFEKATAAYNLKSMLTIRMAGKATNRKACFSCKEITGDTGSMKTKTLLISLAELNGLTKLSEKYYRGKAGQIFKITSFGYIPASPLKDKDYPHGN